MSYPAFTLRIAFALATAALVGCASSDPDPLFADGGGQPDLQLLPDAARCLPNNDGVIDRDEVAFVLGLGINYRINPPGTLVDVDVAGSSVDGTLQWDLSATAQSSVFSTALRPVTDQWFAPLFANASFTVPVDVKGELWQVYRLEGDDVLLLGLVSKDADKTRLIYDTPVPLIRFPLRKGSSYQAESTVTDGKLDGLPIATRDSYKVTVDAEGTALLPSVSLERTLRIRVQVTSQALGGAKAITHQVQFFHECYGEVARMVSQTNETETNFQKAVEFRRLSF